MRELLVAGRYVRYEIFLSANVRKHLTQRLFVVQQRLHRLSQGTLNRIADLHALTRRQCYRLVRRRPIPRHGCCKTNPRYAFFIVKARITDAQRIIADKLWIVQRAALLADDAPYFEDVAKVSREGKLAIENQFPDVVVVK